MIYHFNVIIVQLFIVYNSVMLETVCLSAFYQNSFDCLKIVRLNFSVQIVHKIIDKNYDFNYSSRCKKTFYKLLKRVYNVVLPVFIAKFGLHR